MRAYRWFGGMVWQVPSDRLAEVEWRLRYGTPSKADALVAASVVSAFAALVALPTKRRAEIVRELRKGPTPSQAAETKE